MRTAFVALLAAAALGAVTPSAPARADSTGAAVAAGLGGFALGALVGGAARPVPPPVYYDPPPPRRVYVEPVYAGHCWVERRPVFDEYGDVIGHRPRRVCD